MSRPHLAHPSPHSKTMNCSSCYASSAMYYAEAQAERVLSNTVSRLKMPHLFGSPRTRLPHAYRDTVKDELREMEQAGIIESSSSPWAAPIIPVKKKDGSMRLCVDYRRLNSVSRTDAYPMPRVDDLIDRIGGAKFITTLDLSKGYWQVPVREQDRPKTTFTSPQGLFQFRVMPFGLQGAPTTSQQHTNASSH